MLLGDPLHQLIFPVFIIEFYREGRQKMDILSGAVLFILICKANESFVGNSINLSSLAFDTNKWSAVWSMCLAYQNLNLKFSPIPTSDCAKLN